MLKRNGMREDRYLASNLSALENARWGNVLKYQALLKDVWRPMFKDVPENGFFYGMHRQWGDDHYDLHTVCFHICDHSIGYDYIKENDSTADKFVRCLPEDQLALYINSGSEKVRDAVKSRLKGDSAIYPIPLRQDLVDTYYSTELKSKRLLYSIEFYDKIIQEHFETLLKKLPKKPRYDNPTITLPINGRVYIYRDKGGYHSSEKFLIKPEMVNWVFSESDLYNNDPVDDSYRENSQLSVTKKIKWFKA
jgi:hypothetical protein